MRSSETPDLVVLHRHLRAPLSSWLRTRTPPDVEVDDLLQEVFVRLHRALPRLEDPGAAEAVAWRTARSVLIDALRRRRPQNPLPDDLRVDPPEPPGRTAEVASWLPAFVLALPEPYREAVRLADLEGVSQAEIARRLGLSPSGARTRVQRGRAHLKELLLACCAVRFEEGEVVEVRPQGCDCG